MKRHKPNQDEAQIYLFPGTAPSTTAPPAPATVERPLLEEAPRMARVAPPSLGRAVLSGTFRKDLPGLRQAFEELRDLGCDILSPKRVDVAREEDGFIYMVGEETSTPRVIESRHLEAIEQADFLWLHVPGGYVGLSASLEIGFAKASAIPVFAKELPADPVIADFVHVVSSPREIPATIAGQRLRPRSSLSSVQEYYRRIAAQRGFEKETAHDCFVLLVEEVGELARALRKRERLVRHQASDKQDESLELADILLYVVHMANILGIDLSEAVRTKEEINLARFLRQSRGG